MPTRRASNRPPAGTRRRHRLHASRDARRTELLDAADAVIRRRGPAASMDEIASAAGISKPILYRHFGDKGGLYRELVERYVAGLMEEIQRALAAETDPRTRLAATIDTYLAFLERESDAYLFLTHRAIPERSEAQVAISGFARDVARRVAVVLGEELRRAGVDSGAAEPYAFGLVGFVQGAGDWWMESRTVSREHLTEYLVRLLWTGFVGLTADV